MAEPPTRTRRHLSPDTVDEAALRIIDAHGAAALSMRRLADDLGVGTMTLYSYVRNKDELIDRAVERFLSAIPMPPPDGADWRDRLAGFAERFQGALVAHPGILDLMLTRRAPLAGLDPFREAVLEVLLDAGFPPGLAVDALTSLACCALGHAQHDRARAGSTPSGEALRLGALPVDRFPRLAALADTYPSQPDGRAFRVGLRALIEGLASHAEQHHPPDA